MPGCSGSEIFRLTVRLPCFSPCRNDGCLHAGGFFRSQIQETPQSPGIVSPPPPFHWYYLGVFNAIYTFNDFFSSSFLLGYNLKSITAQVMTWFSQVSSFPPGTHEISSENVQRSPYKYWPQTPTLGGFLAFTSLS